MKIKTKLTTAIMSLVLVLGLLSVGVYALNQAEVTLGGNLTFSATGVYAQVTGSVEGAVVDEANKTYETLLFSTDNTAPNQDSWQKNLGFNGTSDIVLTINIQNLATDRPLYAMITDTITTEVENVIKTVKLGEEDCLGKCIEVPQSTTKTIVITMELDDVNLSLDDGAKYGYKVELNKEEIATAPEVLEADSYASVAFDYVSEADKTVYAYKKGNEVKEITIPSKVIFNGEECSVVRIGDNTDPGSQNVGFYGWHTLEKVIIEEGIDSIGAFAFYECIGVTSVSIGKGITSIGESAFYACWTLTSITIPDSVVNIGGWAFNSCSSLTSITVKATTPPTLGGNALNGVSETCPIYVPSESVEAYKATSGWSDRAEYIQAITA